jgi:quinol monooxygenase YgiN
MSAVTVVATLRAAKGKADALAALLTEQRAVIRKTETGCLVYRVHRSTQDPDAFLFYEIYADDAAFDAHRASPHLAAYRKRREDEGLLEGSVDVKVYRAITE